MNPLPSDLLVVTDRHQAAGSLPEIMAHLLAAGARWIWLRDRDLAAQERRALARELMEAVLASGAALTVGADVALAAEVCAAGVHVRTPGEVGAARDRLGPSGLIGVSAHSLADVQQAAAAGADYVMLSPIFASASKPGYGPALGLPALREAAPIGIPVLALGGVTSERVAACRAAGAAGVAVMGPAMRANDPADFVRSFRLPPTHDQAGPRLRPLGLER